MKYVNAIGYKNLLETKKTILMVYSGATCAPCAALEEQLCRVEDKYKDVVFAKVYIIDILNEAVSLNILSTPTVILYSNGRAASKFYGLNSYKKIIETLDLIS